MEGAGRRLADTRSAPTLPASSRWPTASSIRASS